MNDIYVVATVTKDNYIRIDSCHRFYAKANLRARVLNDLAEDENDTLDWDVMSSTVEKVETKPLIINEDVNSINPNDTKPVISTKDVKPSLFDLVQTTLTELRDLKKSVKTPFYSADGRALMTNVDNREWYDIGFKAGVKHCEDEQFLETFKSK